MSMQDCACNKPTPAINGYKYAYGEVLSSFLFPLSSVIFPFSSFLFPLSSFLLHRPSFIAPVSHRLLCAVGPHRLLTLYALAYTIAY